MTYAYKYCFGFKEASAWGATQCNKIAKRHWALVSFKSKYRLYDIYLNSCSMISTLSKNRNSKSFIDLRFLEPVVVIIVAVVAIVVVTMTSLKKSSLSLMLSKFSSISSKRMDWFLTADSFSSNLSTWISTSLSLKLSVIGAVVELKYLCQSSWFMTMIFDYVIVKWNTIAPSKSVSRLNHSLFTVFWTPRTIHAENQV